MAGRLLCFLGNQARQLFSNCFICTHHLIRYKHSLEVEIVVILVYRKNVGYASTCNAVGQTAGYFIGNVVYLTLDSPDFANRFFRTEPKPYGLVSLSGKFFNHFSTYYHFTVVLPFFFFSYYYFFSVILIIRNVFEISKFFSIKLIHS